MNCCFEILLTLSWKHLEVTGDMQGTILEVSVKKECGNRLASNCNAPFFFFFCNLHWSDGLPMAISCERVVVSHKVERALRPS